MILNKNLFILILFLINFNLCFSSFALGECAKDCSKATIQRLCNVTDSDKNLPGYYVECKYVSGYRDGYLVLLCNYGCNVNNSIYSKYFPQYDNCFTYLNSLSLNINNYFNVYLLLSFLMVNLF